MLTADRVSVPLTDGRLPISRELFANDAVMTEGLPFRTATIGVDDGLSRDFFRPRAVEHPAGRQSP